MINHRWLATVGNLCCTGIEEGIIAAEAAGSAAAAGGTAAESAAWASFAAEGGGFGAFDAATTGLLGGEAAAGEAAALGSLTASELAELGPQYGFWSEPPSGFGTGYGGFDTGFQGYGLDISGQAMGTGGLGPQGYYGTEGQWVDYGFTGEQSPFQMQNGDFFRYLTDAEVASQPGVGAGEVLTAAQDVGSGFPYGPLREATQGITEIPSGLNIPQQFGSIPVNNALKEGGVPEQISGPLAGAGVGAAGSLSSTDFGGDFGSADLGSGELGDLATGDELTLADAGAQAVEGAATSAGDSLINTNLPESTGGDLGAGIGVLGGTDGAPVIEPKPLEGGDFGGFSFDGGISSSPSEVTPFGGFGGGGGDAGLLGDAGGDMLRGYEGGDDYDAWKRSVLGAEGGADFGSGDGTALGFPYGAQRTAMQTVAGDAAGGGASPGAAAAAGGKPGFFTRLIDDPGTVGSGMMDKVTGWVENNPIQAALAAMTVYGATRNGALTGTGQPNTIAQVPGGKEVTAASTRAAQVADAELQRFQTGQLNPGQQQQLDEWRQNRLNETNNYYAKANMSGSTMHIQASQFINGQYEQLKQKMIDSALTNGLAALGSASKEVATAANFQLGQDQAFQSALANATKAVGYLAGNAPRLAA